MKSNELSIRAVCTTNGNGLWTGAKREVVCRELRFGYLNDEEDFGELRVEFTTKSWNIDKHGLIYTDPRWIREFRSYLRSIGFSEKASRDVDYSEQGMQGDCYVSLDFGKKFYGAWRKMSIPDAKLRRQTVN